MEFSLSRIIFMFSFCCWEKVYFKCDNFLEVHNVEGNRSTTFQSNNIRFNNEVTISIESKENKK